VDANHDQKIDFPEFQQFPMARQQTEDAQEDLFEKIDGNRDLRIDATEWQTHWENHQPGKPMPTQRPAQPRQGEDRGDGNAMMENGI
jgi:hypothetical protein